MSPIELGPIDSYSGMAVRREFADTDKEPHIKGAIFVPATSRRVIIFPNALMLEKKSHEKAVETVTDDALAIEAIRTILRDGQTLAAGQQPLAGRQRTDIGGGVRVLE